MMILTITQSKALDLAKKHGGLKKCYSQYWIGANIELQKTPQTTIFEYEWYGTRTVNDLVRAGKLIIKDGIAIVADMPEPIDIFEKIDYFLKKEIVIDCVAVNQKINGYGEQVKTGDIPLITYTVEVMNTTLNEMLYTSSCDSFKEALEEGIKAAEKYLKEVLVKK